MHFFSLAFTLQHDEMGLQCTRSTETSKSSHLHKNRNYNFLSYYVLLSRSAEKGLDHVAENILSYLDASSLCAAELVCREWQRVISEGMLWKKLVERKVRTDSLWRGLAERRGW